MSKRLLRFFAQYHYRPSLPLLDTLIQDFRYALRGLGRSPGFAVVALLMLGLGIGGNAAVFSLLDTVLLRRLPVHEPDRLVLVTSGDESYSSFPIPVWDQIRDRQLFDGEFAWTFSRLNTARGGPAVFVDGIWATGRFFEVLQLGVVLGRPLVAADDQRGGGPDGPVAVISYRFWQERFGGVQTILGQIITIESVPFTIVGVTPESFQGLDIGLPLDVILPMGAATLTNATTNPFPKSRFAV